MQNIQDAKTWKELLEWIVVDHSKYSKKEVAKNIIGISEKSYFDIINGRIPKERLTRILKGFVKKQYNAELILGEGMNIKIQQYLNINGDNNKISDSQKSYGVETRSWDKQRESLLNRVIELEDEIKELKSKKKRKR